MPETAYVVILNYNGKDDTIECVESVLQSDWSEFKILICDNASTDDSVAEFEKIFSGNDKIVILKSEVNNGFSAGNNIGLKFALAREDCGYCWFLNNDTAVDKSALSEMILRQKETGCAAVGSVLLRYDEPEKIQCVGGTMNLKKFSTEGVAENLNVEDLRPDLPIDILPGASFLVTRDALEKVGEFDESFFLYCEEMDFAERLAAAGLKLTYAAKSFVRHKGGASTQKIRTVGRDYHLIRSWTIFLKKHYPDEMQRFAGHVNLLFRKLMKHVHFKRAAAVYKGHRDGKKSL